MAFENISKGKFISIDKGVFAEHISHSYTSSREDASFIAYCLNLQQHYDISKLEEAVDLLSKMAVKLLYGFDIKQDSDIHKQLEQILKQTKK